MLGYFTLLFGLNNYDDEPLRYLESEPYVLT